MVELARPVLFTLVGCEADEIAVIERRERRFTLARAPWRTTGANHRWGGSHVHARWKTAGWITSLGALQSNELCRVHRPLQLGRSAGSQLEHSLIVHDMRHRAIQLQQIEGRCHRDGERAVIYYAFAEDTVEESISATVVTRMAAMDGMAGDDTSIADEIARVIVESVARRAELGDAA